jgi:hypothetical protein
VSSQSDEKCNKIAVKFMANEELRYVTTYVCLRDQEEVDIITFFSQRNQLLLYGSDWHEGISWVIIDDGIYLSGLTLDRMDNLDA